MVTSNHLSPPSDALDVWAPYMRTFGIRMCNPAAYAASAFPLRGTLWALDSAALDFRAAQNVVAMVPRDGRWFSIVDDHTKGKLVFTSPLQGRTLVLPVDIFVGIRASWSPAHMAIRFENDGASRKISPTPLRNFPSIWRRCISEKEPPN